MWLPASRTRRTGPGTRLPAFPEPVRLGRTPPIANGRAVAPTQRPPAERCRRLARASGLDTRVREDMVGDQPGRGAAAFCGPVHGPLSGLQDAGGARDVLAARALEERGLH